MEESTSQLLREQKEIIKGLEDEIAKHRRIIAAIQTRRNSYVPKISTLPPEILTEIFRELQLLPCHGILKRYGWLKAAHVCRYWRDMILSCPRLFSDILLPIRDPQHLEEFLRLSTTSPLTIRITIGDYVPDSMQYAAIWRAILPHLPRTEYLGIWADPDPDVFDI